MCFFGGGSKKQSAPPPPPAAPVVPTQANTADERRSVSDKERKAARLRAGGESTILTGALGVQDEANTKQKTLLGS